MISVMFQLLQLIAFIIVNRLFVKTSADCYFRSTIYDSCGDGVLVGYPFIGSGISRSDLNESCGYPGLVIDCAEGIRSVINISNHRYYVIFIDYNSHVLRVVDGDVDGQQCPHPRRNISLQSTPSLDYFSPNLALFYNCSSYPKDVVQNMPCLNDDYKNNSSRSFAFDDGEIPEGFNWYGNCEESVLARYDYNYAGNLTRSLQSGFDLSWSTPPDCEDCEGSGGWCSLDTSTIAGGRACFCNETFQTRGHCQKGTPPTPALSSPATGQKIIIGVVAGVGGLLLLLLVIYRRFLYSIISWWRNKIKSPTNVEIFLESCGSLPVQRYKYSDTKKITNSFKETLGQGGFGTVFKGKLRDGRLVAVKVLDESKGNGEDFINEVATIGRTNHVNVVSLLGVCTDGAKRALIYEFMSNGSLENFIYSTTSPSLGWEKLFQIALGIARGLEYLHRGCNTRILHFDIKPHNILLDHDFCPKISDFGLAKLCQTRESVVSIAGPRGTRGYIAPEVTCINFGGVSHKSDVYSYGMMVLEMIGGRKNIDITVENTSGVHFPQWIYNHLKRDIKIERPEDIKIEGSGETFEDERAKKMIIVALWCIQTHPVNRPSISNVVEMLQGNIEELQLPPNPFEDPPSTFFPSST